MRKTHANCIHIRQLWHTESI